MSGNLVANFQSEFWSGDLRIGIRPVHNQISVTADSFWRSATRPDNEGFNVTQNRWAKTCRCRPGATTLQEGECPTPLISWRRPGCRPKAPPTKLRSSCREGVGRCRVSSGSSRIKGAPLACASGDADYTSFPVHARAAPRPGQGERNCPSGKEFSCIVAGQRLLASPPNFARACGRVSVGGHPDKRPDSRPE